MPIIVRKKKKRTATNDHAAADGSTSSDKLDHHSNDDRHNERLLPLKSKETIVKEVRHAISNLQRGVRKILVKTKDISSVNDRSSRKVDDILLHMEHCMIHLQQHVNVLQIGLHCYMNKLLPHIYNTVAQQPQSNSSTRTEPKKHITYFKNMMQHLFYWLLHLHDGYIYTISGECRQLYDQKQHQKQRHNKFQSQLNLIRKTKEELSKDEKSSISSSCTTGTTNSSKLYSPDNIYSGTSWDEYMDPINGLRHRLLRTILHLQRPHRPPKPDEYEVLWDTLIEDVSSPGYGLELIVTQIEQQMQQIQMMFTKLTKCSGTVGDNYLCQTIQKTLVLLQSQGVTTTATTTIPTVTLHWKDKMESLRITSSSLGTIVLERYGNTFQTMKGNESILPLHYTAVDQWWKQGGMEWAFTLPSPSTTSSDNDINKKRRRIIRTNDDDDDNQNSNIQYGTALINTETSAPKKKSLADVGESKTETSNGLVVKVIVDCTDPHENSKVMNNRESVNDIKVQFGVNINDRENAYDIIQAEEAGATYDAQQIDHDECIAGSTSLQIDDDYRNRTNDVEELPNMTIDDEIQYVLQRLKRTKRTFIRLLKEASRSDSEIVGDELNSSDINIWNAREVLREAFMSAGDVLLWSVERRKEEEQNKSDIASSNMMYDQDCVKTLQTAIQFFRAAKDLVTQQQKLHKIMNPDPSHDAITHTFFCRNLLLLQTKAQINIGIGYVQLGIHGHPSDRDPYRQTQFQSAVKECQYASDMTLGMDNSSFLLLLDYEKNDEDEQIIRRDWLEALQLRALAIRWKAISLWYLHKKSESFNTITKVILSSMEHHPLIQKVWNDAHKVSNIPAQKNDMTGIMDSLIDFYLENYYAWTAIADLASQSLERATVASVRESDKSKSFYDTLLDYAVKSLSNAAKLSQTLKENLERSNLMGRYNELCEGSRLLAADDLNQTLNDIKEWWKRRLTMVDALTTNRRTNANIERGELFSSAQLPVWEVLPTRRFIIQPKTRRSKYNLGGDSTFVSDRSRKFGNHTEKNCNRTDSATSEQSQQINTTHENQARPFRKWREEMTYDPKTETFNPCLVYPSIAPPMPTHIQEMLKRKS